LSCTGRLPGRRPPPICQTVIERHRLRLMVHFVFACGGHLVFDDKCAGRLECPHDDQSTARVRARTAQTTIGLVFLLNHLPCPPKRSWPPRHCSTQLIADEMAVGGNRIHIGDLSPPGRRVRPFWFVTPKLTTSRNRPAAARAHCRHVCAGSTNLLSRLRSSIKKQTHLKWWPHST
jgi:hypothetical protein